MSSPSKNVEKPIPDFGGKQAEPKTETSSPEYAAQAQKPTDKIYLRNEKYAVAWKTFFDKVGSKISDKISKLSDLIILEPTNVGFQYRTLEKQRFVSYVEGMDKKLADYVERLPFTDFNLGRDENALALGITSWDRNETANSTRSFISQRFFLPKPHIMARWMNDDVAGSYLFALDLLESKNQDITDFPIDINVTGRRSGLAELKTLESELCALQFQYELNSHNIDTLPLLKEFDFVSKIIFQIGSDNEDEWYFRNYSSQFYRLQNK